MKQLENRFDVIVDEYTMRPFLSPRYAKCRVIFLVHELAREKWFYETPFPLSAIGYAILEPAWLRVYRGTTAVTVSQSTKNDLVAFGLRDVRIVTQGLSLRAVDQLPQKESEPTFLYLGLLKRANLVDHSLRAFSIFSRSFPNAKLWVAGKGPEEKKLRSLAKGLNADILGYVTEDVKRKLMSRAHALLVPAIREGWGLAVTEANACGTPAIGYDVPGLRDSIIHDVTGVLVAPRPEAMARAMMDIIHDPGYCRSLAAAALARARKFSWARTASEFTDILSG